MMFNLVFKFLSLFQILVLLSHFFFKKRISYYLVANFYSNYCNHNKLLTQNCTYITLNQNVYAMKEKYASVIANKLMNYKNKLNQKCNIKLDNLRSCITMFKYVSNAKILIFRHQVFNKVCNQLLCKSVSEFYSAIFD